SIKIYNASGHIIQTLNLGHKPRGIYTTKEFAASWDGRNDLGERVASGLYFYLFVAGDYQATRVMVLLKKK
ncbi:hypothetical protein H8E77_19790, partial [bacterium]|nr:hypothetical protein [bacterium]